MKPAGKRYLLVTVDGELEWNSELAECLSRLGLEDQRRIAVKKLAYPFLIIRIIPCDNGIKARLQECWRGRASSIKTSGSSRKLRKYVMNLPNAHQQTASSRPFTI